MEIKLDDGGGKRLRGGRTGAEEAGRAKGKGKEVEAER